MIKTLSIIIAAALSLSSCCRNVERKKYGLSNEHRISNPHTDNQSLKFVAATGEEFEVQIHRSDFKQNLEFYGCGAECCDELVNLEFDATEFTTTNTSIP